MFRKKNKIISILFILLVGSTFYSCVDEPTIESVKNPYAVLRIGNFSLDTQNPDMNISVDDKNFAIPYKGITDFFDVKPGNRQLTITRGGNVIFDKQIELSSYEEMTLMFYGQYSTIDTLNNFAVLRVDEGAVYHSNAPGVDKASVQFVDLVSDFLGYKHPTNSELDSASKKSPTLDITEGATLLRTDFTFKDVFEADFNTGDKTFGFSIYKSKVSEPFLSTQLNLGSNKRYIIVLSGTATNYTISAKESDPLPVRYK